MSKNIAVIGAAGMVGSNVVTEAKTRGHQVHQYTRSGSIDGSLPLDLANTEEVVKVINGHDVTVVTVASRDDYQAAIDAHKALIAAAPKGRFLVIGGAGALNAGDGYLWESDGFPEEYLAEAKAFTEVYEAYRNSNGLNWSMLAPAPMIAPGTRTGQYVSADDVPAGGFVSAEDFAVAAVDEIETPAHEGQRFTVASSDEEAAAKTA